MTEVANLDPRRCGRAEYHQSLSAEELAVIEASPEFPAGDGSDVRPPQDYVPPVAQTATKTSKAKK